MLPRPSKTDKKKYPICVAVARSVTETDKIFLVLWRGGRKKIRSFHLNMTRGHCFEVASCHLVFDRKRDNFVCFALKATAQEPIVLKIRRRWSWVDWKMIQRLPPKAGETPTHRVSSESPSFFLQGDWKVKAGPLSPPPKKVFVPCPGRASIFGRGSFLRVTILHTGGKLPISMPTNLSHAYPCSCLPIFLCKAYTHEGAQWCIQISLKSCTFSPLVLDVLYHPVLLEIWSWKHFRSPHVRITCARFGLFLVFKVPHIPHIFFTQRVSHCFPVAICIESPWL